MSDDRPVGIPRDPDEREQLYDEAGLTDEERSALDEWVATEAAGRSKFVDADARSETRRVGEEMARVMTCGGCGEHPEVIVTDSGLVKLQCPTPDCGLGFAQLMDVTYVTPPPE